MTDTDSCHHRCGNISGLNRVSLLQGTKSKILFAYYSQPPHFTTYLLGRGGLVETACWCHLHAVYSYMTSVKRLCMSLIERGAFVVLKVINVSGGDDRVELVDRKLTQHVFVIVVSLVSCAFLRLGSSFSWTTLYVEVLLMDMPDSPPSPPTPMYQAVVLAGSQRWLQG